MQRASTKIFLRVAAAATLVILSVGSCYVLNPYWRLLSRSSAYYSRLAIACDQVMAEHGESMPQILHGAGLRSLPVPLQQLSPSYVIVRTNHVMVRVDEGIVSYKIVWAPDEWDGLLWHLRVHGGDTARSRMLFSDRKAQPEH